ncbi:thioredoxin domain-containing protein 15-like [Glandiceps talaboti]
MATFKNITDVIHRRIRLAMFLLILCVTQGIGEDINEDVHLVNSEDPVVCNDDCQYDKTVVVDDSDTIDVLDADFAATDSDTEIINRLAETEKSGGVDEEEEVAEEEEEGLAKEGDLKDTNDENSESIIEEPCQDNVTVKNESNHQGNQTEDGGQKPKYTCTDIELQENETIAVKIINNTDLFQLLNRTNSTEGPCSIVLFYAPWCRFSANVAPHVNALGRAYPTLHVLAIDAIEFSSLNARFGTVAVPNLLLFHNGKPVARFNQSERTFEHFKAFIKNHTGIEGDPTVEVSDMDYIGPLPSKPIEEPDYFLWFSTIFLFGFSCYVFKQKFGDRIMERVRTWAEIHEHMD